MTTKRLGGIEYFPLQLKIPLTSYRITPKPTNRKPPTQHAISTTVWQGAIGGALYNPTLMKFHINIVLMKKNAHSINDYFDMNDLSKITVIPKSTASH